MRYLKIIGLGLFSIMALYINAFYLIFILAVIYGALNKPLKPVRFSTGLFFVSFLIWAGLILIGEMSFYNSPSITLSQILGGLPSWIIPIFGGLIGGILSFLGSLGGAYMMGQDI